mmetsp:Transcript_70487/g.197034  ORF Transcript_70487/g.197034 Transcript_70487/m.197034 type:complete len:202 (-) Transcript_70487:266-871(-)|eukprot:CAMPEP_0119470460 /NCGR_PEP_ID=MMETSP1344-20130328/3355_1 /TAXON_ID=236787 /ORGANISM="Florenciella parvula, Strain CCMP2471" /LENGTH=201 /DNA_ID=CAMNT_0007503143 /DNA_START=112 /DNA_END=717 /DNA_ORIENTATION=-
MAAATAAVARVNLKHQKLKEEERTRALEEQKKTKELFMRHDKNGSGQLEKAQLTGLLVELNGSKPVDAELVDKVFDAAAKNGPAGQPGVAFDQLMPSIKKFAAYVRQNKYLDAQFAKYDTDQSGHLEREQLRAFLQDLSKGKEVEDGDLDFVLEKVDEINGDINGVIDRDELLPAAALWKELQDSKKTMQYKFESTFCTLS